MTKIKHKGYDYGKCEICHTHIQERRIKIDFWIRGELIVIDDIKAGVCPLCGEKIVNAKVGQNIAKLLKNVEYIAKAPRIKVPVVNYKYAEKVCA